MKQRTILILLAAVTVSLAAALPADAQSLWGVDGMSITVTQMTGPPAGPCGYPTGPVVNMFPYPAPWVCPTAGPFPPMAVIGDVAVDLFADTIWVTDGFAVTEYTKAGLVVNTFMNPLPLPLSGLGWSASPAALIAGMLWLTDGTSAAAVTPPPPPGCGPPAFVVPPFPLMATPLPATDIDFDPGSGTLFLTSAAGLIANELVGGGPGPFGVFPPPCFGGYLDGIAVDRSTGKNLYATDGMTIAYMTFAGAPAAPTFYTTASCFGWAGPVPISGLGFDAAPIGYGKGSDSVVGAVPPVAGAVGQAVSPNPAFALTLGGAAPGGMAYILVGTGAACPPLPFWGCGILTLPILTIAGPIPVPAAGALTIPAAIPAGFGYVGASAYVQWLIARPLGGFQTTQGLELTLAAP